MKVAIWAAVSTPNQAKAEKVSIKVQLQKGRDFIAQNHYTPAGEYIVPGESRTKHISLYHAEKEIPQLHALLEAASKKEFDLLFVYDLNRFRSLMRQIYDALCDYNIQLYIATNPRQPVPPNQYTEEHKAAVGMIVDLSNIISRNEINTLQRHFQEKMPGRIKRGLDARLGSIPYGYKRIHPGDKEHPLVIDPAKAKIVKQIANWYLSGESFKSICKKLNDQNIPSPENSLWYPETIRVILSSPYYAGLVYFGREKYHRDRRTGKETRTPNPNPTYNQGKHQPLWDQPTHQKLLDLIEQRGRGYKGDKTKRLSRLLYCYCGAKLYHDRAHTTRQGEPLPIWYCSSKQRKHTFITDKKAQALVIPAIVQGIRNAKNQPTLPKPKQDLIQEYQQEINELERKQKRLLTLYEEDTAPETSNARQTIVKRLKEIQNEIDTTRAKIAKQTLIQNRRTAQQTARAKLAQLIDTLEGYYTQAPAAQVNADLHTIITRIEISKTHQITIHWRGEE